MKKPDPWICPTCSKEGVVQLGTQEKPYGALIVRCPKGHEWRELMSKINAGGVNANHKADQQIERRKAG